MSGTEKDQNEGLDAIGKAPLIHLVKQTVTGNAYAICAPMIYLTGYAPILVTRDLKAVTCPGCRTLHATVRS